MFRIQVSCGIRDHPQALKPAVLWFKLEAATRFPSILPGGSLIPIVLRGEAVPALRPAGIPSTSSGQALPAAENKGKMPSPHGDGFSPIPLNALFLTRQLRNFLRAEHLIVDANIINKFRP
jgi:hypothetical protein